MKRIVLSNWISLDQDFLQVLSEVHLIDCPTITDVSCLQNVHTLSISRCRGVTDVSSLHKVHTLHLSHCEGISSILDLTGNSCLSVVNCPKVMDFRNVRRDAKFSLEHPHFLQITGLPNEIHEMTFTLFPEILFGLKVLTLKFDSVAILKIVDCLELTEFPVAFLKTRMRTVVIEQCESLHDVSALGNVLFVSISSCNRLRSLAGLGKDGRNQEISLSGCRSIVDFSPLNGLKKVCVQNCIGLRDLEQLRNVSHLIVGNCWCVERVSGLGKDNSIDCLELINNRNLRELQGLENIPVVVLSLSKPMDISSFQYGTNEKLVFLKSSDPPSPSSSPSSSSSPSCLLDWYSLESYQHQEVYLRRRIDSQCYHHNSYVSGNRSCAEKNSVEGKNKQPLRRSPFSNGLLFLLQCICH